MYTLLMLFTVIYRTAPVATARDEAYHVLRGSASPLLTATGKETSYKISTLKPIAENCQSQVITLAKRSAVPN